MVSGMRLDKYRIQKGKIGFCILCIFFLMGIGCITKIADLFTKTEEIEAMVVNAYETSSSVHTHNPGGWKMNIEWVDLNGNVQTEGNLRNKSGLEAGDTYTILVDAKTQSRRVLSKAGSIFMFVMGICVCGGSIILTKFCFGREY